MAETRSAETLGFQAEVKQLLHLMIHSLYSNREIFLRELISNASDAADKLRFEALADPALMEDQPELRIDVDFDAEAGTVSVSDNGIGMNRDEVIANLGTIAKSGTAEFLQSLTGDTRKDSRLIGQFGVGFYSSFIVADRVEVYSRRAGQPADTGIHWESDGQGEFRIGSVERPERGTRVVLHLREDAKEFAAAERLRHLIRRYSDHIAFPVTMPIGDGDGDGERETVNAATALWTRPRAEIGDEEYREFYKHLTHDPTDPLAWSHNHVEGKRQYTSLLYIPGRAPFDLWNRESPRGLKLYVQRVFIMDDAEQFLPLYLRFVRGVIDTADLPLNVSRELLQSHPTLDALRSALTRRALELLEKTAADDAETYQKIWDEFGEVLKEGIGEDPGNAERIAALLRFVTTRSEGATQDQSLDDYIGRVQTDQEAIYYLVADSLEKARSAPQLEVFRDRGIEVLLLHDRLDEWMIGQLPEYSGKKLSDVARGGAELPGGESGPEQEALDEEQKPLLKKLRRLLKDQVETVRVSRRLVDSPACLVLSEHDVGRQMRHLLEAAGQKLPETKPIFEINPSHPLVQRLSTESDEGRFEDLARVLVDQARLAEGGSLEDPGAYVRRMNRLLLELAGDGEQ
ncbi:molecular chaperone HtpG [Lentisalinibacter salinarum]|uniref:molecular chaperone HtpG n=1 Tax=Lentisalinibacter salinarum TaxID=2992239 RepID=UPI003865E6C3